MIFPTILGAMRNRTSRRWRQAAVWIHVLTSVGWMGQALALFTLLALSLTTADAAVRSSAIDMAEVLDDHLLAPLANASAFTGFMLSASTAWGFFRHWWVLAKFAITVVQLYVGIFLLSGALRDAAAGAAAHAPSPALLIGTGLMASAIAFQAWLAVAKPWQRTPWNKDAAKPATAPNRYFALTVLAPLLDAALGGALGFPSPVVELIVLVTVLISLRRRATVVPAGSPAEPDGLS